MLSRSLRTILLLTAIFATAVWLGEHNLATAKASTGLDLTNGSPVVTPTPPVPNGGGVGTGSAGENNQADQTDPADPIYDSRDVTKGVRVLSKPQPSYTEQARATGASGTIRINLVFRSSGKVTDVRPVNYLPDGLTEAAINAARSIKFEPAVKDGQPVSQHKIVEYNFNLWVDENDPNLRSRAEILVKPDAEYTDLARQHNVHGTVVLQLMLNANGTVRVGSVIQGLPDGLTESAVKAAEQIQFTPAMTRAGNPIGQFYRVEYKFKL
jgi:TonB family protein